MAGDLSDATHTVDGVEITPGLWVWDNNLDSVQVSPYQFPGAVRYSALTDVGGTYWDGWYRTLTWHGGNGPVLNGERMVTIFEGLRAEDCKGMSHADAKRAASRDMTQTEEA